MSEEKEEKPFDNDEVGDGKEEVCLPKP